MSSPSTRAEGSTSSRPIPNRTLPHPSRLSVAHRDQSGQLDVTQTSDVLALSRDVTKRAGTSKQAEKWAERIMEETVSAATFKKAVSGAYPAFPPCSAKLGVISIGQKR